MMRRFALLLLAACSTSNHHSTVCTASLQMNDLSVLLPLPQTQADLSAMLAPSAPGVGGALLPDLLEQYPGPDGEPMLSLDGYRAVAFRIDPCFGQLGELADATACQAQLRVVFQQISYLPGDVNVEDSAVHAFYTLTRDQLIDVVDAVVQAREDASGDVDLGPLAPNPTVAQQGLTGTLAQALAQVVTQHAGVGNLVRVTALEFEPLGGPVGSGSVTDAQWTFASFDVAAGSAAPRAIPTLSQPATSMNLYTEFTPLEASPTPVTAAIDDLTLLASYSDASRATPAALGSAFDAALRIENPRDHSADTIDCASCHIAEPAIDINGAMLGMSASGRPDAFVADASIPSADLAQTTPVLTPNGLSLNVHAFSYDGTSPMINQRVINDTARNLAYVQTLLP